MLGVITMIDVKIINAVIEALTSTFKSASKTEIKLAKPQLLKEIGESFDIITSIGFNGVLEGNLIYTVPVHGAVEIVNNMMNGMMEITQLDDMALSAIGELANMISGAIAISLERTGFPINITPPSVVNGTSIKVNVSGQVLKFPGNFGNAEIDVFLVVK